MRKIKIGELDELLNISLELGVITYLQQLVQKDPNNYYVEKGGLLFAFENADAYLWDKQYENVIRLRRLLESKDFAEKI